jgi:hypothetical protein
MNQANVNEEAGPRSLVALVMEDGLHWLGARM